MSSTGTLTEWPASVALLGTLAALLAVLATSQGTGTFEWPIDLLVVLAITGVAAAVGTTLSVVLPDETSAGEGAE